MIFYYHLFIGEVRTIRNETTYPIHGKISIEHRLGGVDSFCDGCSIAVWRLFYCCVTVVTQSWDGRHRSWASRASSTATHRFSPTPLMASLSMIFYYHLFIGEVRTIRNETTYPIHGKYPLNPNFATVGIPSSNSSFKALLMCLPIVLTSLPNKKCKITHNASFLMQSCPICMAWTARKIPETTALPLSLCNLL